MEIHLPLHNHSSLRGVTIATVVCRYQGCYGPSSLFRYPLQPPRCYYSNSGRGCYGLLISLWISTPASSVLLQQQWSATVVEVAMEFCFLMGYPLQLPRYCDSNSGPQIPRLPWPWTSSPFRCPLQPPQCYYSNSGPQFIQAALDLHLPLDVCISLLGVTLATMVHRYPGCYGPSSPFKISLLDVTISAVVRRCPGFHGLCFPLDVPFSLMCVTIATVVPRCPGCH